MNDTEPTGDWTGEALVAYVKDHADAEYWLGFVDRDDRLTMEQVQAFFRGPSEALETENDIRDNFYEGTREAAETALREMLGDDAYEALEQDDDSHEHALQIILDRDQADVVADLWRNTGDVLLRYRLRDDWADFPVGYGVIGMAKDCNVVDDSADAVRALAEMFGVSVEQYGAQMHELLQNASYGGSPELLWYGDAKQFYKALDWNASDEGESWAVNRTMTFDNPHALIMDNMNGSGHDVLLDGVSITVPFDPSRIVVDKAKGNGWGWDATAGLVMGAYRADVTVNLPPEGHDLSLTTEAVDKPDTVQNGVTVRGYKGLIARGVCSCGEWETTTVRGALSVQRDHTIHAFSPGAEPSETNVLVSLLAG